MSASLKITAALQQHLGQNSKQLMRLAYQSMDCMNDVKVLGDVKNKIRLTTLKINSIVKPYNETFAPKDDAIEFIPREAGVDVAKADLKINPEDYRQTYLAEFQKKGVTRKPEDLPFAKYVMEDVFKKFGEELNSDTAYNGSKNAAGTDAVDVTDGWGTILADEILGGNVVPEVTGAIVKATAIEQLKAMVRNKIPEKYRVPRAKIIAYMSLTTYDAYQDNLDALQVNTGRGEDHLKPKWLRGYEGIIEVKPVSWMAGSGRVIMTPYGNMVMLQDAIAQDMSKVNIVEDVWYTKMGIACALGFNFAYLPFLWVNDVV